MKRRISPAQSVFLDATRGISALAVLIGHALTMLPSKPALGNLYPIQSYGVVVFFIISGFLIGHNCMYRENYTFTGYMIDRFSRVFTVFGPVFVFVIVLDLIFLQHYIYFPPESLTFLTAVSNLLMFFETPIYKILPGFPISPAWGSARQWWTVAVEWWLYVVFGIMFFLATATIAQRAFMAVLAVPALLVVSVFFSYESLAQVWFLAAFVGCVFTVANIQGIKIVSGGFIAFFLLAYFMRFGFIDSGRFNAYDLSFIMISTGLYFAIMFSLDTGDLSKKGETLFRPVWRWLADISYSLYLTHLTILGAYHGLIGLDSYFDLVAVSLVCIAIAHIFTVVFDVKHRDVRSWLKQKHADYTRVADRFSNAAKVMFSAGAIATLISVFLLVMATNTDNHADKLPENPDLKAFQNLDNFNVATMIYFGALPSNDPNQGRFLLEAQAFEGNSQQALEFLSIYEPELIQSGQKTELLSSASQSGQADAMLALYLKQEGNPTNANDIKDRNRLREVYDAAVEMNHSDDIIQQERGARTLLKLALYGHIDALTVYADAVRGRRLAVVPTISQIVPLLENAAASGNALAAFMLGDIFARGERDIKKNTDRAGAYFLYAIQRGYQPAKERFEELNIKIDEKDVFAIQKSDPAAEAFRMGNDVLIGTLKMLGSMPDSVAVNMDDAARREGMYLLNRAARNGSEEASRLLAIYDATDWLPSGSVPKNLVSAAASDGWPDAMLKLKTQEMPGNGKSAFNDDDIYHAAVRFNTHQDRSKRERGARVLKKLASHGHVSSMTMYGDAIRGGRMMHPPMISVAVTYWIRASLQGDALAAFILAETYATGAGDVEADEEEAKRYYELAAARNYPPAKEKLAKFKDR